MADNKPAESKKAIIERFENAMRSSFNQQLNDFFGDKALAAKFISSVVSDMQRNPKLSECTPQSLLNSYMSMAQFGFMPSSISGEAYVLPYDNSKKENGVWVKVTEAQLQIGYQGLVTLFYKAGVERVIAEIVRENDVFSIINGEIKHEIDFKKSNQARGEWVGAYVTIYFDGKPMSKYMHIDDIYAHGKRYSKSFDLEGKYSPWNPENDREGWMPKKTVLKQLAKLVPKNETILRAIEIDNQDSIISDVKEFQATNALSMGNFLVTPNEKNNENSANEEEMGNTENTIDIDK